MAFPEGTSKSTRAPASLIEAGYTEFMDVHPPASRRRRFAGGLWLVLPVLGIFWITLLLIPFRSCPICGVEYREAVESLAHVMRGDFPPESREYHTSRVQEWRCLHCGGRARISVWNLIYQRFGPLPSER